MHPYHAATWERRKYRLRAEHHRQFDPSQHELLFERFLNPHRASMPDIDLDFDERRQGTRECPDRVPPPW